MTPKRSIRATDMVKVDGERTVWKVLAIASGNAHLTKLCADPRLDWRDVPVTRLSLTDRIIS